MKLPFAFVVFSLSVAEYSSSALLVSNPEGSPQVLSDTANDICSQQGRSSACEVELDVPSGCIGGSSSDCPIVFFLHGAGGSNNGFARASTVHGANVIGVYPQGENGWNTGPKNTNVCEWDDFACTDDPDEGAFIAGIISELRSMGATGNIYVIGNSNGAALAHRLAANAGDDLPVKGIVTKVTQLLSSPSRSGPGNLNYNQPHATGGPRVSVLNLMGLNDNLIPYGGGGSSVFGQDDSFQLMSALASMETWAVYNGCSDTPDVTSGVSYTTSSLSSEATLYEYLCPDDTIVEHYALGGAGHSFGREAELDGVLIDYDLAFQFIRRVEEGLNGANPPAVPSNDDSRDDDNNACVDDPTWSGKHNADHTCEYVANDPSRRCNWESTDGIKALVACAMTCGECEEEEPTPSHDDNNDSDDEDDACVDDPTWYGKHNVDHTCGYIANAPSHRCNWESIDGTKAAVACACSCFFQ